MSDEVWWWWCLRAGLDGCRLKLDRAGGEVGKLQHKGYESLEAVQGTNQIVTIDY